MRVKVRSRERGNARGGAIKIASFYTHFLTHESTLRKEHCPLTAQRVRDFLFWQDLYMRQCVHESRTDSKFTSFPVLLPIEAAGGERERERVELSDQGGTDLKQSVHLKCSLVLSPFLFFLLSRSFVRSFVRSFLPLPGCVCKEYQLKQNVDRGRDNLLGVIC